MTQKDLPPLTGLRIVATDLFEAEDVGVPTRAPFDVGDREAEVMNPDAVVHRAVILAHATVGAARRAVRRETRDRPPHGPGSHVERRRGHVCVSMRSGARASGAPLRPF